MSPAAALRAADRFTPLSTTAGVQQPLPSTGLEQPEARTLKPEFPMHRTITVHVTGGLDGALRVATMLRGRGYRVRDLTLGVREGVVESRLDCTIALTAAEAALLLERLRRMPAVVAADNA